MECNTLPHPTIIKIMRTFLEAEGKWVQYHNPQVANIGPLSWTQTPVSGRTMLHRRERGQHLLKDFGLVQPLSLVKQPHAHLQLFPKPQSMLNPKQMLQKIGPNLRKCPSP